MDDWAVSVANDKAMQEFKSKLSELECIALDCLLDIFKRKKNKRDWVRLANYSYFYKIDKGVSMYKYLTKISNLDMVRNVGTRFDASPERIRIIKEIKIDFGVVALKFGDEFVNYYQ